MPICGVLLSDTFRYFQLLVRRGSELFGVSAQNDSVVRIWHSSYTLIGVIVPISGVFLYDTFRYFLLLVRRGSELFEVSTQIVSGFRILAFFI